MVNKLTKEVVYGEQTHKESGIYMVNKPTKEMESTC